MLCTQLFQFENMYTPVSEASLTGVFIAVELCCWLFTRLMNSQHQADFTVFACAPDPSPAPGLSSRFTVNTDEAVIDGLLQGSPSCSETFVV